MAASVAKSSGQRSMACLLYTSVVHGENDLVIPVSQSVALAEDLPDAELVIIPACGHVAQEECPVAFMDAVEAWLAARAW